MMQQSDNITVVKKLAAKLKIDHSQQQKKSSMFRKICIWCGILVTIILIGTIVASFIPLKVTVVAVTNERAGAAGHPIFRIGGYVNYARIVNVSTSYDYPIIKLNFKEGDRVREGDVMAKLYNADLIAQEQRETTLWNDAKITLDRVRTLYNAGVRSYTELQKAETQERSIAANLNQTRAQLERTIIHAPFSGIISRKLAEIGGKPGSGIYTLIDDSKTLVEVDVSQNDLGKITEKQPAIIVLDAYPDNEYAAEVDQIMPTGDKSKNTVQVKVRVLSPDNSFRPEMSAKVFFVRDLQQENRKIRSRIVVPKAAIEEDGKKFVWKVVENNAVRQEIIVGEDLEDRYEVVDGLTADTKVILEPGKYHLKNGQQVQASI